jgi:hypothetical protein
MITNKQIRDLVPGKEYWVQWLEPIFLKDMQFPAHMMAHYVYCETIERIGYEIIGYDVRMQLVEFEQYDENEQYLEFGYRWNSALDHLYLHQLVDIKTPEEME